MGRQKGERWAFTFKYILFYTKKATMEVCDYHDNAGSTGPGVLEVTGSGILNDMDDEYDVSI